jgi:hypothetical protein
MMNCKTDIAELNLKENFTQFIAHAQKAILMIVRGKRTRSHPDRLKQETCRQIGTGFFISPKGTAVTNHHVLKLFDEPLTEDETLAAVYYDPGLEQYQCVALKEEATTFRQIDIAILELNCKPESWLPLYEGRVHLGEGICTLGYPAVNGQEEAAFSLDDIEGRTRFCCASVCSVRKQDFVCNKGLIELRGKRLIEIDRYMANGLSGSPVFSTSDGQVVGVVVGTKLHVEHTLYTAVYEPHKAKESVKPLPFIVPTSYVLSVEEILPFIRSGQSSSEN